MTKNELRYPQLAKEPLIVGTTGPNTNNRIWAKAIDLILLFILIGAFHWIWAPTLLPFTVFFWGVIEGAGRGQSPGKWLLGLHTIESGKGRKVNFYSSFIRNLPFVLITLGVFWDPWFSWILIAIGFILAGIELYFVFKIPTGVRVGDVIGKTRVFDFKDEHTLFIERFLRKKTKTKLAAHRHFARD